MFLNEDEAILYVNNNTNILLEKMQENEFITIYKGENTILNIYKSNNTIFKFINRFENKSQLKFILKEILELSLTHSLS